MTHLRAADGSVLCEHEDEHEEQLLSARAAVEAEGDGGHDHSHGLVDRSILRSRAGVRAVALSLLILGLTAGAQVAVFVFSSSVALLADLIHNFGDAVGFAGLGASGGSSGCIAVAPRPATSCRFS